MPRKNRKSEAWEGIISLYAQNGLKAALKSNNSVTFEAESYEKFLYASSPLSYKKPVYSNPCEAMYIKNFVIAK